jgi:hypothetical protein
VPRPASDEPVDRARRRLLKAGLYAAPFVATFGVFLESAHATHTGCSPCGPQCRPNDNCAPHKNQTCGPHGGG